MTNLLSLGSQLNYGYKIISLLKKLLIETVLYDVHYLGPYRVSRAKNMLNGTL